MSLKQNLSEVQLLKFKNIRIVYLTPKNDLWAIFDSGIKKCITKNFGVIIELPKFLKDKNLISYKDSLKIKKGVSFIILVNNSIDIILKKKIINIEFLNKQNILNLLEEFKCKKKVSSISNYHIKDISISNTEGLNFLKTIVKNNSVDLVLTDPPYLISTELSKKISLKNWYSKRDAWPKGRFEWDNNFDLNTLDLFIEQYYLKLKSGGTLIIFFDIWKITLLKTMLEKYKFKQIRFIEWVKKNPVPINSKINYLSNCREVALVAVKDKKSTFNSIYDKGIYEFPIEQRNRFHPNQKNLDLFERLIFKHSNENDLVLDTFFGSGASAVASKNTNRKFIGCELEKKYFIKTIEWLNK